jgi:hypothetical protein
MCIHTRPPNRPYYSLLRRYRISGDLTFRYRPILHFTYYFNSMLNSSDGLHSEAFCHDLFKYLHSNGARSSVVEALYYRPEGRGFDSQ